MRARIRTATPVSECASADEITHLRVFNDGFGWMIDGASDEGCVSEACWGPYSRFDEATESLWDFAADNAPHLLRSKV